VPIIIDVRSNPYTLSHADSNSSVIPRYSRAIDENIPYDGFLPAKRLRPRLDRGHIYSLSDVCFSFPGNRLASRIGIAAWKKDTMYRNLDVNANPVDSEALSELHPEFAVQEVYPH